MTHYLAFPLILASSAALAAVPPQMPAASTPMTVRDDCFQRMRGHEERRAQLRGYQIQALVAAYGSETADGGFACSGQFEIQDGQGRTAASSRRQYVIFQR